MRVVICEGLMRTDDPPPAQSPCNSHCGPGLFIIQRGGEGTAARVVLSNEPPARCQELLETYRKSHLGASSGASTVASMLRMDVHRNQSAGA